MDQSLRVAFFPDTYDEVDGVANTSRQFEAFAKKSEYPFLMVCGGAEDRKEDDGSVTRITCRRGPIGFVLDEKHDFDLLFWRHYDDVAAAVQEFSPDVIHITGPSDVGQLGALLAHRLRIPLAASWHTNLHEYAEQRASALLSFLPERFCKSVGSQIRQASLAGLLRFYKIPWLLFAPNPDLINLLRQETNKPVYPMGRGVDLELFAPERRDRRSDGFVIGYVGRLTTEKNIRLLAEIERALIDSGLSDFRFSIVGQGAEESWLKLHLRRAEFLGVLKSEALARAYANMDVFVFPSRTDTFGNVVLEALSSGVPAVVTNGGGPQFIVRHGETGFIARDAAEFASRLRCLAADPGKLKRMRLAARARARRESWSSIFNNIYACYRYELQNGSSRMSGGPQHSILTASAPLRDSDDKFVEKTVPL